MKKQARIGGEYAVREDHGFDGIMCNSAVHCLCFQVSISKVCFELDNEVEWVVFSQIIVNFALEPEWLSHSVRLRG